MTEHKMQEEHMANALCRVVTEKNDEVEKLCGKDATVMWPVLADDDITVLDYLFACPEHDQKYEEGHTIVIKDMRGFVFMFQKPLNPKDDTVIFDSETTPPVSNP